ncbi:MAG: Na-K-Cl cotransporter [Bacteroidetes bacterium]|nr:MAG: Na-K-Cl cotransporter [Bacteroidota bacterium]RLD69914.1 MAG: Na-K-Cl cotransporter [Bacteroidota bacterium]
MEHKRKKFGAFSGVFTPSILTILGVIMYLRLGWVTGVAGLWGVIAIILIAHVISVTTGLSIASVATDKRIEAGGIYYILSRSLGLPMGGAIGITLFVGTALSISLYIIGFAENFLSLNQVQELLHLAPDSLNSIRIVGSVVLVLLVIIALISTNFAIKTQFIILAAIVLSLISIFVGIFMGNGAPAEGSHELIKPFRDFSFVEVFAIFFPAVTGFTAGVAMSGDLKDPKKNIPNGTLLAIITGLVVYLTLAVCFYFFIDHQLLLNNYNFLMAVAWIPLLVVAGVWGATLSSALGGVLGGPRIIQAIAQDRIVPGFLGKGYGKNNEPRNALIFTFFIAELGILVGDLNVIAGIVTMFYLTAYGVINISFALEKWASTDFRPSFRIPIWIGILGFLASFMVMFQLDMLSMLIALVIVSFVYYFINKKQLHLAMGDVWQSVRYSILRKMLTQLDRRQLNERNWRPNILLFSGGTKNRPHLIEFGKYLVGEHGVISNFDLVLNKSSKVLFPKNKQQVEDDENGHVEGIFARRQECNNIYEGIKTIAATYGFSGVEPNTVLLGWGRQTSNPIEFAKMLKYLSDLDLNIVLLDYDTERGFGRYQQIDIWWRGGSNNGNLILSLIKFLRASYDWRLAKVRLMIINYDEKKEKKIIADTQMVLDNMRMDAEIKVVNNGHEKLPVNMIIKRESANADLIFLGLAEVQEGMEKEFVKRADELYKDLGTIALVKASSFFKELHIGL